MRSLSMSLLLQKNEGKGGFVGSEVRQVVITSHLRNSI